MMNSVEYLHEIQRQRDGIRWESYNNERDKLQKIPFDHFLHDPRAMPFFLDFLSQLGQPELLLFWLEVEEYKQLMGRSGEIGAGATKIVTKYFKRPKGKSSCLLDELFEGKVSDRFNALDKAAIVMQLEQDEATLDMFTDPQLAVEDVLRERYHEKFRSSQSFRALLEELQNRKKLDLAGVVDNQGFAAFFEQYLEDSIPEKLGNYLFLYDANERVGARAHGGRNRGIIGQRAVKSGLRRSSSSMPAFREDMRKGSGGGSSSSSSSSNSSDSSSVSGINKNNQSSRSISRTKTLGSYSSTSSIPSAQGGKLPTPKESTRPATFLSYLPVSAAPPSTAMQLKNKREELLSGLNQAYVILDAYLSRGSNREASQVSDESKRCVKESLESINVELGGGSGKLASVGGFATVATAFAVLDSLEVRLAQVFEPAQKEIRGWLNTAAFQDFQRSEYYAALMAYIEEQDSEAHRERNLLRSMIHGKARSEKLLVLKLPKRTRMAPATDEDGGGGSRKAKMEQMRKFRSVRDVHELEGRRKGSYLWNTNLRSHVKNDDALIVDRVLEVVVDPVADERYLLHKSIHATAPTRRNLQTKICDCPCHYDNLLTSCMCDCNAPSLTRRSSGLVFRTRTNMDIDPRLGSCSKKVLSKDASLEHCKKVGGDPQGGGNSHYFFSNAAGEEDGSGEIYSSPASPRLSNRVQEIAPFTPQVHAYMLPLGLQVRVIDAEEVEGEDANRLTANFRTRKSSDADNITGFLVLPPKPGPLSKYEQRVISKVIDETTKTIEENDVAVKVIHVDKDEDMEQAEAAARAQELEKVRLLEPSESIHCFVMPQQSAKRSQKLSRRRFWYGVCHTSYDLRQVVCPSRLKQSGGGINDNEDCLDNSNSPRSLPGLKSPYQEITVTLAKHPEYGLGLNLLMNKDDGFMALGKFMVRGDGQVGPAARCGALKVRDVLLSVNGLSIANRRFDEVVKQIKMAKSPVTFTFARGWEATLRYCTYCSKLKCRPAYAFVPRVLSVVSQEPLFDQLHSTLLQIRPFASKAAVYQDQIVNVLAAKTVDLSLRLNSDPRPPSIHFPLMQLFRFVRKEYICDVLASLLLNRPVILLSDSPTMLVMAGEAFRTLLWPFVWRYAYHPLLPIPLARGFAEARQEKLNEYRHRSQVHQDSQHAAHLSTFFIGICTLEMGARDTDLGEFTGFDEIADWMLNEHDNLRPFDRFMSIDAFSPLVEEGTVVLDIDADHLEVPLPSPSQRAALLTAREASITPATGSRYSNAVATPTPSSRFGISGRRHRASSVTSSNSLGVASSTSTTGGVPNASLIPRFPDLLRDRLIHDWASLSSQDFVMENVHAGVMSLHSSLLRSFREYFVTSESSSSDETVVAFNVRMFLLKCPRSFHPYLRVFLSTKSFHSFLVELVYTKADIFTDGRNTPLGSPTGSASLSPLPRTPMTNIPEHDPDDVVVVGPDHEADGNDGERWSDKDKKVDWV